MILNPPSHKNRTTHLQVQLQLLLELQQKTYLLFKNPSLPILLGHTILLTFHSEMCELLFQHNVGNIKHFWLNDLVFWRGNAGWEGTISLGFFFPGNTRAKHRGNFSKATQAISEKDHFWISLIHLKYCSNFLRILLWNNPLVRKDVSKKDKTKQERKKIPLNTNTNI